MKTETSPLPADSGLIIGFSGTYYCLWSWWTENTYTMTGSGNYVATSGYTKYGYLGRISTDLAKVKQLYPNLQIDEGLRGTKWVKYEKQEREPLADDVFPHGYRSKGMEIMKSNEVKHLWSLYLSGEQGIGRNKVYARRRLVELGLLVPYKTSRSIQVERTKLVDDQYVDYTETIILRRSYCSPKFVQKVEFEKNAVKGHFFENGKRVKLMLKQVKSFSFDSQYGTCYVIEYMDAESRVFKYKGSTPPEISKEDFEEVQATIKHGEYKGQAETQIQRIKTLSIQY